VELPRDPELSQNHRQGTLPWVRPMLLPEVLTMSFFRAVRPCPAKTRRARGDDVSVFMIPRCFFVPLVVVRKELVI
jgi:hypothetical protein